MKIIHEICERFCHFGTQGIFQIIKILREVLKPQMLLLVYSFVQVNALQILLHLRVIFAGAGDVLFICLIDFCFIFSPYFVRNIHSSPSHIL